MYLFLKRAVMVGLLALVGGLVPARADTLTWTAGTGDWFAVENWTNWTVPASTRVPAAGDDVVVSNVSALVYLANATPYLSSLVISNAYLSCSNWDTTIYATNLTILNGGFLTCYGPFTNNAVSNRVRLTCTNLVIETGGSIYVKGKGFAGGTNAAGGYPLGSGPGAGPAANYGGSYGGAGSFYGGLVTGKVYGSYTVPLDPGSGGVGGYYSYGPGGNGGGAVCITAAQVVVNGSINADAYGTYQSYGGDQSGGSGGGIFITCTTIAGAGTITASGEASYQLYSADAGAGGGGGRIAVIYDTTAQAALGRPAIRFVASGALGSVSYGGCSDIGTLYFPDSFLFSSTNLFTGEWQAPGLPNLAVADLLVSNAWLRLPADRFSLTVTRTLSIIGTNALLHRLELTNAATVQCGEARFNGGSLVLGGSTTGPTFNCTGDLTLTNRGRFYVVAGLTNTASPGYGALVNVGGDILLYSNSWIYPSAHPTNGTPTLFNMCNLAVNNTNSGFNADYRGYAGGAFWGDVAANVAYGPGGAATASQRSRGSSHGGFGGAGSNDNASVIVPGSTVIYGSSNAPVDPGSGARQGGSGSVNYNYLVSGGGSVQIRATKTVSISGTLTANGRNGRYWGGGGASGGGIYITCRTFIGNSNAVLQAKGGPGAPWYDATHGHGGGGSGGRIAVWRCMDKSPSVISNYVDGGGGYATGGPGTIVWGWLPGGKGTIFTIH